MPLYQKEDVLNLAPTPTERRSWGLQFHGTTIYTTGAIGSADFQTIGIVSNGDDIESRWMLIQNNLPVGGLGLGIVTNTNSLFIDLRHDPIIELTYKTTDWFSDIPVVSNNLMVFILTSQQDNPIESSSEFILFSMGRDDQTVFTGTIGRGDSRIKCPDITEPIPAVETSFKMRMRVDHANQRAFFSVNDGAEVASIDPLFNWTRKLGFAAGLNIGQTGVQHTLKLGSIYCHYKGHD